MAIAVQVRGTCLFFSEALCKSGVAMGGSFRLAQRVKIHWLRLVIFASERTFKLRPYEAFFCQRGWLVFFPTQKGQVVGKFWMTVRKWRRHPCLMPRLDSSVSFIFSQFARQHWYYEPSIVWFFRPYETNVNLVWKKDGNSAATFSIFHF